MRDAIIGKQQLRCLDHGHVTLVDVMPRMVEDDETGDHAILRAARVSTGSMAGKDDRGLIRYMMRHRHTSPFEQVEFKFHCKMPIFVARQWIRHRTANVNEVSGRYSVLKDEFHVPEADEVRRQSTKNKQGSEGGMEAECFIKDCADLPRDCYDAYKEALKIGVSREQARMLLPLSLYTEWFWKIDLHNLLHFLALRCDSHAQYEIRVFADAMLELIRPIVPWSIEAWEDYHPMRDAATLTRLELEAIRNAISAVGLTAPRIATSNDREQEEWMTKAERLGFRRQVIV